MKKCRPPASFQKIPPTRNRIRTWNGLRLIFTTVLFQHVIISGFMATVSKNGVIIQCEMLRVSLTQGETAGMV